MARYQEIADDLRHRISAGEWGEVGARIPTLSELMTEYGVAGVQTVRAAQAVLVNEGILETRHGSGAFITRLPATDTADIAAIARDLERLEHGLTALRQRISSLRQPQLTAVPHDPPQEVPGRSWMWASWSRCVTCGSERGVTRGWADSEDEDSYDPSGYCREQGHNVTSGVGLSPNRDPAEAAAIESWWEYHAQNEEAAALLLSGNHHTALWHAHQARTLADEYENFNGFTSPVTPPRPSDAQEASVCSPK